MASLEYLEKLKRLQDKQHESELNRLQLEQQMNVSGMTDSMLSKLRSVRLENYWKKVCDDERKSRMRNQQLLADLDRLDMQASQLCEDIESLISTKALNESYVEELYPGLWRRYSGQLDPRMPVEDSQTRVKQPESDSDRDHLSHSVQRPANGNNVSSRGHSSQYGASSSPDVTNDHGAGVLLVNNVVQEQRAAITVDTPHYGSNSGVNDSPHRTRSPNVAPPSVIDSPSAMRRHPPSSSRPVNSVSSAAVDRRIGDGVSVHSESSTPRDRAGSLISPRTSVSQSPEGLVVGETNATGAVVSAVPKSSPARVIPHVSGSGIDISIRPDDVTTASLQTISSPLSAVSAHTTYVVTGGIAAVPISSPVESTSVGNGLRTGSPTRSAGAVESFQRIASAPSSGPASGGENQLHEPSDDHKDTMVPSVTVATKVDDTKRISAEPPTLSWDGLFHLLFVIENNIKLAVRGHQQQYYGQNRSLPAEGVCTEIINLANRKAAMSHVNVTSLCQVVTGQLSALCHLTHDGCLLTDRALINFTRLLESLDEVEVRKQIHISSVEIWKKLFSHLLYLVEHRISSSDELAATFGPLLTSYRSPCQQQAISVLSNLLETAADTVRSPTPSASEFSIGSTPRNAPSPRKSTEPLKVAPDESALPKIGVHNGDNELHEDDCDPDGYQSESDGHGDSDQNNQSFNERFIDYNNMSRSLSLKQKAAYDRVLGTGSSFNSSMANSMGLAAAADLDSSDDDLEKILAPPTTANVSTVPQKPTAKIVTVPPPAVSKEIPAVSASKPVAAPASALSSLKMSSSARSNIVFRAASDLDDDNVEINTLLPSLNRSGQSQDQQRSQQDNAKQTDEFEDDDFWNDSGK